MNIATKKTFLQIFKIKNCEISEKRSQVTMIFKSFLCRINVGRNSQIKLHMIWKEDFLLYLVVYVSNTNVTFSSEKLHCLSTENNF